MNVTNISSKIFLEMKKIRFKDEAVAEAVGRTKKLDWTSDNHWATSDAWGTPSPDVQKKLKHFFKLTNLDQTQNIKAPDVR